VHKLNDEQLMAYADGELDAKEAKAVEAILARDPDAVKRLEAFKATRGPLADLFSRPSIETIPDPLLDILKPAEGSPVRQKARGGRHGRLHEFLQAWTPEVLGTSPAMAFSLLLLVSAGGGWLVGRVGGATHADRASFLALDGGSITAKGALREALESTPSSKLAVWSGTSEEQVSFKPVLSFRSTYHQYCRQYELNSAASGSYEGFACRNSTGAWHITMHEKTVGKTRHSGGIKPAAGRQTTALDAVVDQIIDGDALGVNEENKLLLNQWQEQR